MKPGAILLLALVALLSIGELVATEPVAAGFMDHAMPLDRLQQELARTDQVINRAGTNVRSCASVRAQALLEKAIDMQKDAWRLYGPTGPNVPVERILLLTRKARDLAVDAIEACQVEFQAQEALRTMLDTTTDLVREAGATVARASNPGATRLLEAGTEQLDRAQEAYRAGDYRRAITLGGAARSLVQRALQRARGGVGGSAAPQVESALDRAEALLAEVRLTPGSDSDPRARVLLERAGKDLERGRDLLDKGRPAPAWRLAAAARESAMDALWLLQRVPEPAVVERGIDLVSRLLVDVEPEVAASPSAEARRFLDEARQQIAIARSALQAGNPAGAAQSVRTADTLLRRAADMAGR